MKICLLKSIIEYVYLDVKVPDSYKNTMYIYNDCSPIYIYIYIVEQTNHLETFFLNQKSAQILTSRAGYNLKKVDISPLYVSYMMKGFIY